MSIRSVEMMREGKAWGNPVIQLYQRQNPHVVKSISKADFLLKYPGVRHQGIVVNFEGKIIRDQLPDLSTSAGNHCFMAIDNVEDPQNLGQIIRTAECAEIDGLIIPRHHTSGITSTVLQVSQGAFLYLPIYVVTNLKTAFETLKKQRFWVIGFENSHEAKPWHRIRYEGKVVCVVGSEGKGIRKLVLQTCDFQGTIPMRGKINSLNVSATVSAILFERNRQIYPDDGGIVRT